MNVSQAAEYADVLILSQSIGTVTLLNNAVIYVQARPIARTQTNVVPTTWSVQRSTTRSPKLNKPEEHNHFITRQREEL